MTTTTTDLDLDLDAIKARAEAATPGIWHEGDVWVFTDPIYEDDNRLSNVLGMTYSDPERAGAEHQRALRNVRFIAHAREDVPALVAEVERLRKENARLRDERDRAYSALSDYGRSAVDISGDLEDGINAERLMARAEGRD